MFGVSFSKFQAKGWSKRLQRMVETTPKGGRNDSKGWSKQLVNPNFFYYRFGGQRIRTVLSIFTLFLYIFTKISVGMFFF